MLWLQTLLRSCSSQKSCEHIGFPTTTKIKLLSLATTKNSLARVSRRTIKPQSILLILIRYQIFFQKTSSFKGNIWLSLSGFRYFSPPNRGTFQLSFTVLLRYRSWDVFRIRSRCLPHSNLISNRSYSRTKTQTTTQYIYGTITLYGRKFQNTSIYILWPVGLSLRTPHLHIYYYTEFSLFYVVFARRY